MSYHLLPYSRSLWSHIFLVSLSIPAYFLGRLGIGMFPSWDFVPSAKNASPRWPHGIILLFFSDFLTERPFLFTFSKSVKLLTLCQSFILCLSIFTLIIYTLTLNISLHKTSFIAPSLVLCSACIILKFLITFEQGPCVFSWYWTLQPT